MAFLRIRGLDLTWKFLLVVSGPCSGIDYQIGLGDIIYDVSRAYVYGPFRLSV